MLDKAIEVIVPLAAVGVISMSIIQTLKSIFPLKQQFYKKQLVRHFEGDLSTLRLLLSPSSNEDKNETLQNDEALKAICEQDNKPLFNQLKELAEPALDFPTSQPYSNLYTKLFGRLPGTEDALKTWKDYVISINKPQQTEMGSSPDATRSAQAARDLLHTRFTQDILALQRRVNREWRQGNQVASVVISFVLLIVFYPPNGQHIFTVDSGIHWIKYFSFIFIGSVLAPFAKDLMVSLVSAKNIKNSKI